MRYEPGDSVPVTVGGVSYPVYVDPNGVYRFVSGVANGLFEGGALDLNRAALLYKQGKCGSQREWCEFYMSLGYSVCGFCDLSDFFDVEVVTPNWTREGKKWA